MTGEGCRTGDHLPPADPLDADELAEMDDWCRACQGPHQSPGGFIGGIVHMIAWWVG